MIEERLQNIKALSVGLIAAAESDYQLELRRRVERTTGCGNVEKHLHLMRPAHNRAAPGPSVSAPGVDDARITATLINKFGQLPLGPAAPDDGGR